GIPDQPLLVGEEVVEVEEVGGTECLRGGHGRGHGLALSLRGRISISTTKARCRRTAPMSRTSDRSPAHASSPWEASAWRPLRGDRNRLRLDGAPVGRAVLAPPPRRR